MQQHFGTSVLGLHSSAAVLSQNFQNAHFIVPCDIPCQARRNFMGMQGHMQNHVQLDGGCKDGRNVLLLVEVIKEQLVKMGHLESRVYMFFGKIFWQGHLTFVFLQQLFHLVILFEHL